MVFPQLGENFIERRPTACSSKCWPLLRAKELRPAAVGATHRPSLKAKDTQNVISTKPGLCISN